ncbi:MAG: DNA replication/repair protein RecF [Pyrinomonadaceae bacterium]
MFLQSIAVDGFRNLTGRINCTNGINILYGANGQGKTNWLESIHILANARSFRTRHLHETLTFGEPVGAIRGIVHRGDTIDRELRVAIQHNTRQTFINGKREVLARYLAQLHAVSFTSEELEVVRGGPEARRNFLDRGVVGLYPVHAQTLSDYSKVIKQKKRLLDQAAGRDIRGDQLREFIEPWNQQLISLSAQIHGARVEYVELLQEALEHTLFGDALSIRYVSSLETKGDLDRYEELIAERLRLRLEAEIYAGACLIGPHRDDFDIRFRGQNLRSFGSAGQQRSALITLDLAALSVYHSKHQNYPIFLIDDVDAELDGSRIESLLEYLDGRTQTFVTTSKRSYFERFNQRANFYEVRDGLATEETLFTAAMTTGGNVV